MLCGFLAAFALRRTRFASFKPLATAWFFLMVNGAALVSVIAVLRGHRVRRWEPERHQVNSDSASLESTEGQPA